MTDPLIAEIVRCNAVCPLHWVVCFRSDYPRAFEIKRQQQAVVKRYIEQESKP